MFIDSFHKILEIDELIVSGYICNFLFRYYNNAYYAKVGGISTMEMNHLELDFLFGLRFQLNVSPNTFHIYCSYLQSEMLSTTQPKLQIQTPIEQLHSFPEDQEARLTV